MRVAVINLTGGGMSGGYRKYLAEMLPRFAAHPGVSELLCASSLALDGDGGHGKDSKVKFIRCSQFRMLHHRPDSKLAEALDSFAPEVLFIPVERYVRYKKLPVVVMLQNMAPLAGMKTGTGIKEWLRTAARRFETRYALRYSTAVIVPTEFVKDFLSREVKIDPAKIYVVPYGNTAPAAQPLAPYGVHKHTKFIFTAGSLEMYRGLEDLLFALPDIRSKFPEIKLAIAGGTRGPTRGYAARLKSLAKGLGLEDAVVWLGNISEPELSWAYFNCAAFVLTSRVESFCLIALESMAHGCNIVSTKSACLPEILADAATYYDAGDALSLSHALMDLLSRDPADTEKVRSTAMSRAAGFSWDETASKTLNVLKNVFDGKVHSQPDRD